MKKVLVFIKKYILVIIVAFIILVIGSFLIVNLVYKKINIKIYDTEYIKFNYDSSWNILSNSDLYVKLENKNKGIINIELLQLDDNYKYEKLDQILDNLLFDINEQNKNYNLIFKKDITLTNKLLDGYEVLYETNDSEVMLSIAKNENYLIMFTFEADNKYFDMLLDSVQNIIYNFEIKENKYKLNNKLELSTENILFSKNNNLDNKIKDSNEYEIASNNYLVSYLVPNIFKVTSIDSRKGSFSFQDDNATINVTTTIYNKNIYDYLDKTEGNSSIYEEFNFYKENKDKYSNFEEQLSKYKISNYDSYLYKVFYTDKMNNKKYENYSLIVPINKNHIFLLRVIGENSSISEKLINSFKINKVVNYSSYINREVKDGYFNINLERLNNKKTDSISIRLSEKYQEIDEGADMYSYRYIGLNKDTNNNTYQYNINYNLTSPSQDLNSMIDLINFNIESYEVYGNYNKLKYLDTLTLNEKQFKVYEGSYFKLDNLFNQKETSIFKVNEKVLIYELENGGMLIITIDGNNKEIEDNMLNELTDITILKN